METIVVRFVEQGDCVKYEFDDGSYFVEVLHPGFFEETIPYPAYGEYSVEELDSGSLARFYLDVFYLTGTGAMLQHTLGDATFIKFGKYL